MSKAKELSELGDAVTVDSGNVGIGVSPTAFGAGYTNCQVTGTSGAGVFRATSTSVDVRFQADQVGLSGLVNVASNHPLVFNTNAAERMRIDSSGDVLINSTSATGAEKVHIAFDRTAEWGLVIANTSSTAPSGATMVDFRYAGTQTGSITSNGTTTAYNTSSDYRLKENVVDMDGAIDRVKALQPKRFNFIADADTTVDGFLAHEVSEVIPEAIHGEKDAVDGEGNAIYQGIDQSKLVPLLTGALKEAIAKIETLEARITALENA